MSGKDRVALLIVWAVLLVLSFPMWVWFVSLCVRAAVDWGWLP